MAKPEQKIVDGVRQEIRRRGGYSIKEHGSMYSSGQPDIIGCVAGRAVVVECKAPGKLKTVSTRQLVILQFWEDSGAFAMVCDNVAEFVAALDAWLEHYGRTGA